MDKLSFILEYILKKQEVIPLKHEVLKAIHILSQNTAIILQAVLPHADNVVSKMQLGTYAGKIPQVMLHWEEQAEAASPYHG